MAVHQPIKEERQASEARTSKSAYTKRRAFYCYINSQARSKPTHCLQLTICGIQGQPPRAPEARASHKQY